MQKRLIEIAFNSMEKNKIECLKKNNQYIKADSKVKGILEEIGAELPGDKKNLVNKLKEGMEGQADKRDIVIYELGLKQGVILKATETDLKKVLSL